MSTKTKTKVKTKAVAMYRDGVLLARFPSISLASKLTDIQPAHIGKVASGLRKTAGGSVWKYTQLTNKRSPDMVVQKDAATGELLAVYTNLYSASEVLDLTTGKIHQARLTNRTVKGSTFA